MGLSPGPAGPINSIERGAGAPVVLLHGLGGNVGFWTAEIAALSDEFRVIAIDLRGSGALALLAQIFGAPAPPRITWNSPRTRTGRSRLGGRCTKPNAGSTVVRG
jgi:pimeloyl-ACP methyl ester carboxylesterase